MARKKYTEEQTIAVLNQRQGPRQWSCVAGKG